MQDINNGDVLNMKMKKAMRHSGYPARIIRNPVKSIAYSALSGELVLDVFYRLRPCKCPELLYLLHPCSRGYRVTATRLPA